MKDQTQDKGPEHAELYASRPAPGATPGTLVSDPEAPKATVEVIAYNAENAETVPVEDLSALPQIIKQWQVTWINVYGLGDAEVLNRLGELFDIHPLALADVSNVNQRPKIDNYGDLIYVVSKMISRNTELEFEQISLFLGKKFVLVFQEHVGDCFGPVRKRIQNPRGRLRKLDADYLAYALLDATIDYYFPVLERYDDLLEAIEDEILEGPSETVIKRTHEVRRDLLNVKRAIWPQREVIGALLRDEHPLIKKSTVPFLRDCQDHVIQIIDLVETYREINSSLNEVYLSQVSNRMNEVMKVLTIIATIFIPLTFIAGIYGMNFENMPELSWKYGYFYCLGLMTVVTGGMVWYFLKKRWLR